MTALVRLGPLARATASASKSCGMRMVMTFVRLVTAALLIAQQ